MAIRQLTNITEEPIQRHRLTAQDITIDVTLRWMPQVESWFADVEVGNKKRVGIRLVLGTLHIQSANMPTDMIVRDTSDINIDPIRRDDFATGRCELYFLMPDEMEEIRGAPVPI